MNSKMLADFQIWINVALIIFQRFDAYLNEPIEIGELIKLANKSN